MIWTNRNSHITQPPTTSHNARRTRTQTRKPNNQTQTQRSKRLSPMRRSRRPTSQQQQHSRTRIKRTHIQMRSMLPPLRHLRNPRTESKTEPQRPHQTTVRSQPRRHQPMKHSEFTALNDDEVAACPNCDSSKVRIYSPGGYTNHNGTGRYACRTCDERFDEYVTRKRRQHGPTSGLAHRLHEADPDEVTR